MGCEEDRVLEVPNVEYDVCWRGSWNCSEEDKGGVDWEDGKFLGGSRATWARSGERQGLESKKRWNIDGVPAGSALLQPICFPET